MATTIDITPTAEETVRIYAYILANHANPNPNDFGDYWNYTEAESELIIKALNAYHQFTDAWELAGLALKDMPQTVKTKFIKSAMKLVKAGK